MCIDKQGFRPQGWDVVGGIAQLPGQKDSTTSCPTRYTKEHPCQASVGLLQFLMGNFFSRARLIVQDFLALIARYQELEKRLNQSPGLPVSNPSLSFWTVPKSSIANNLSELPKHADIVVIGSGLTGASFSRTVLKSDRPLQVVMLDARQACGGASGRCVL